MLEIFFVLDNTILRMSSDATKCNLLVLGVNFVQETVVRKRAIVCVIVLDPALGLGKQFLRSSHGE